MAIENKCCLRWRKASVQSHFICSFQLSELNAFENAHTQSTHINKMLFFFRTKLETIPTTLASVKQPPNLTVVRCSLHGHGAFSENATQVTKQTPQRVEIQVNDNLSIVCIFKQVSYVSIRAAQKFWGLYSQTPKWTTFFCQWLLARCYLYLTFQNIFISVNLYMSPVETWCRNIDYFIPDEEGKTKDFKTEVMTKIRKFNSHTFIYKSHDLFFTCMVLFHFK